jgi:hypothetical protein
MSQRYPLAVLAILFGSCAAPESLVAREASQASSLPPLPTKVHETAHVRIEYRPANHELAPLPDCCPAPDVDPTDCYSAGSGTLDDVPDMIEDLGTFLEAAYAAYTQDDDRSRSNDKVLVDVRPTELPNRAASVRLDETMVFEPRLGGSGDPRWLRRLAMHELFYVLQDRALGRWPATSTSVASR